MRAFKQLDTELPKELRREFKAIAEMVAGRIRGKVPRRTGAAASSVTTRAGSTGAGIAFGGSKAPYFPWLDFGGSVGRGHRPGSAWSGAIRREWEGIPRGSGRYVYPTIAESKGDIGAAADEAIRRVARRADFDTKGSAD